MSKFFPVGIQLNDTQTPIEILQDAVRDWETESEGQLTLILQTGTATDGDDMIFVHGKHVPSNRTITLFSVVFRPGGPYPARIQLKTNELPTYYRKSYFQPGLVDGLTLKADMQGRTVTNEWVAETPSEFRTKLVNAFNLGVVKSEILNLLCGAPQPDSEAYQPADEAPKAIPAVRTRKKKRKTEETPEETPG